MSEYTVGQRVWVFDPDYGKLSAYVTEGCSVCKGVGVVF